MRKVGIENYITIMDYILYHIEEIKVVSKIFDYLYKDATIYMQRKYDIAIMSKTLNSKSNDKDIMCDTLLDITN